jgi:hypothetical protein
MRTTEKLTRPQTLTRIAASLARRRGWSTLVSDSQSTESSYLYIGRVSSHGGLETVGVLRVSNHRPWYHGRAGWRKYSSDAYQYDMRPAGQGKRESTRARDRSVILRFLNRFEGQQ